MISDQVVLFGAPYELRSWQTALRNYDFRVIYWDINDLNDVSLQYLDGTYKLFVSAEQKAVWNPIAGIWRIGAVKPPWQFIPSLEILQAVDSTFPMLNPASSHLTCSRRIVMHSKLVQKTDLPMVRLHAFVTGRYLIESSFEPEFPLVLKIGNYEGGLKKWKINNQEQWGDFFNSIRAFDEPIIIEQFIEFHTEYRSLFVGDDVYLIQRQEIEGWRAQHAKKSVIIDPSPEIIEMTLQAKEVLGLNIGALDFVEGENGYTVFEVNDCPDLDHQRLGIEDNLWKKSASLLNKMIQDD